MARLQPVKVSLYMCMDTGLVARARASLAGVQQRYKDRQHPHHSSSFGQCVLMMGASTMMASASGAAGLRHELAP